MSGYICSLCGKIEPKYEGLVWYSKREFNLCRSHHAKWNYKHRAYKKAHIHIKPLTPAWPIMCAEEEEIFVEWFEEQKKLL